MKIDIDKILEGLARAEESFELVRHLGDTVALLLAESGQPELQIRLADMRAENDASRERRHAKLAHAAKQG